ncbi:hypothetical protein LPUS_03711 [Lasallia pustulata]|uniref:Uncharacterized protein n=1 Tax=Lasallia pustulata TaxID=136370 RepID=A0A1W5CVB5_9LECA|nr:hypothetical protein LPUS_03711 [Lasallia pustulata]
MQEEILRQITDKGLLDSIDLNNMNVAQEDELSNNQGRKMLRASVLGVFAAAHRDQIKINRSNVTRQDLWISPLAENIKWHKATTFTGARKIFTSVIIRGPITRGLLSD